MLTVDLIAARRRDGELKLVLLDEKMKPRAMELAELYAGIARSHVGRSREDYEEACGAVPVAGYEKRLADGLRKLIEDRCAFDVDETLDPPSLRRELFLLAAKTRHALSDEEEFDREALLLAHAKSTGMQPDTIDRALFADLRAAHLLRECDPVSPAALVDGYDLAQAQAVLLRAVKVEVVVSCTGSGAYRALFQKLKFLRLLHRIERAPAPPQRRGKDKQAPPQDPGYRIEIDGPFSLFESVTRYGLALALALPAITACDAWRLDAELRWGKEREPLRFRLAGGASGGASEEAPRLADEVQALLDGLREVKSDWKVSPSTEILDVAGVGMCVPDLIFEKKRKRLRVYLEVMGYWSRDAVWKRVELVERGLKERVLFCVGQQLRVGEAALSDDVPAALLVYKHRISPKTVLEKIDALSTRNS